MKIPSALKISFVLAALLAGAGCLDGGPLEEIIPKRDGQEAPTTEVSGVVTKVVDGDTFDVDGFGRVRLADVDCPEMDTPGGKAAKFFAETMLLDETVHLDVDDHRGKDRYGRWVAVAYIEDPDTSSLVNFNSMLAASGHAEVKDFKDNEFDPEEWFSTSESRRPPHFGPFFDSESRFSWALWV
ncbi:MAG: thermonuclease family protein [Methanothrix sp.]|uniref:Nuclease (SNase domain protein) n=1 Tax=Methanothrix harundinacea TaxID=301375 RepID=A0A101IK79_9EURY|nr:MAG: Nuclease (SNase domain protein) [Methanothrix harundinacea]MDD2638348.1 thermonuclease family protein [Methanothrix sp.]MDI9399380.1 thermonuclease family protein [Euryarchaeota archaeon]KUK96553.1 MAG: Nuclease (SNase domain protein) [Methanothrix harundinacea]MCP1391538.1 thermonuclease family protein [Methanothrix harundinacea]